MEQDKKPFYKKRWVIVLAVFFGIGLIGTLFDTSPRQPSPPAVQAQQPPTAETPETAAPSKEEALGEFTRLMDLSKQSGLVKSYEMSEDVSLKIYVGDVWYTQDVQFKKDMLAKFSTLQDTIYGRHRLEVRDAYSNEKLAEVTAFSGSVEILK